MSTKENFKEQEKKNKKQNWIKNSDDTKHKTTTELQQNKSNEMTTEKMTKGSTVFHSPQQHQKPRPPPSS